MIVLVEAPSIDWELLARKLRGRCAEERIKLHELALMIGVTRTVLWRLTAGVTGCRPEAFMAVCDWLEIDPRTLFKPVPDARHLPALPAVPEPTHCFNADDWEVTYCWSDRADLHDDMFCGDVLRVGRLTRLPDQWIACVPVTFDEAGRPDETEMRWFDSFEEANTAANPPLPAAPGSADGRTGRDCARACPQTLRSQTTRSTGQSELRDRYRFGNICGGRRDRRLLLVATSAEGRSCRRWSCGLA